jgi:hypothetical protein
LSCIEIVCPTTSASINHLRSLRTFDRRSNRPVTRLQLDRLGRNDYRRPGNRHDQSRHAGLAGQTVRASLSIGGYNLECAADCGVSVPLPKLISRKFDEFPDISRNDEKARLDNFGIELQNDPTATAYVIVYPGRSGKRGDVQHHANRIVEYLVNSRGWTNVAS